MALPVDFVIRSSGKNINLRRDSDLQLVVNHGQHGPSTVTWQMCDYANRLPDLRSRVTLRDSTYGYFWSGYAGRPVPDLNGPAQLEARGWQFTSEDDGWDSSKYWVAGTPLINMVFEAIAKCTHISGGIAFPGSLTTTQLPDDSTKFDLQAPRDVFDFVTSLFQYMTTPLVWQVKQNPVHPMTDDPCLEMKFTDQTPVYRVRLGKKDEFKPAFDADTVFNGAMLGYGEGQFESDTAVPATIYDVIPDIRYKRVNANNNVTGLAQAQALVAFLIARNNTLRPVNVTLEIDCDTKIQSVYPATPTLTANVPHWFVFPHYGIRILNDLSDWGPYGINNYYIVETSYNFESGKLSLILGDPIFYDALKLLLSYINDRVNIGIDSGIVNEPLRDADAIRVYGPTTGTSVPATNIAGVPIHTVDKAGNLTSATNPDKPYLPNGAGVHPNLFVDYGVQANFGREADSVGIKGFIQVIPCTLLAYDICHTPEAGSTTIPTDAMEVWVHNVYPFTAGNVATRIGQLTIGAASACNSANLAAPAVIAQRGKLGVEVVTPSAVVGSGFQISLTGKRAYPDIP